MDRCGRTRRRGLSVLAQPLRRATVRLTALRARLRAALGAWPRPSSRPELGDLVAYGVAEAGSAEGLASWTVAGDICNIWYADAALLSLAPQVNHVPEARGWERGAQMWRLAAILGARLHTVQFRPLWLELEAVQFWRGEGARPTLARNAWERALQRWNRIYEREPLAGAQEGAQQFPRLAELSILGCALSDLQPHDWSP